MFVDTNLFSTIFLVVPKKLINLIKNQLNEPKYKDVIICEGGDSRAQSVNNAFSKITTKNHKIFIHDAARPLINKKLIIDLAKFSKNKKATVLAKKINEVWVSSDSKKILSVSKKLGAKTIVRPKRFSGDNASSESAWLDAIKQIKSIDIKKDIIIEEVCLFHQINRQAPFTLVDRFKLSLG